MPWLVDIDHAVADGVLSKDASVELKRRARQSMVNYAINLALFAGVLMVILGVTTWLKSPLALVPLGSALTLLGVVTLIAGGDQTRLVANATAIIGVTLALNALRQLLSDSVTNRILLGSLIGLPSVALGLGLRRAYPKKLSIFGSWIVLLGAAIHISGILMTKAVGLEWIALYYVAAVTITCGLLLDLRFVTGLAIVPLAAALSARTFYGHAVYGVAIYEVTLTIIQMAIIAVVAFVVSTRFPSRIARHGRTVGLLALIWTNMAFWIGSLWGDVVGLYLWGPRSPSREVVEAFKASTLVVPADVFAAIWAVGLLAVGAWGAITARRGVLNIAVTFGAIHFYTQYFERLNAEPATFVVAGIIAILASWALWAFNRRIVRGSRARNGSVPTFA